MKTRLILIAGLLLSAGCQATQKQASSKVELSSIAVEAATTEFNNQEYGVSLEYPSSWTVMSKAQESFAMDKGADIIFEENSTESVKEILKSTTNIILTISEHPMGSTANNPAVTLVVEENPFISGLNVNQYLNGSKETLQRMTSDIEFGDVGEVTINENSWGKLPYTLTKFGMTFEIEVYAYKISENRILAITTTGGDSAKQKLEGIVQTISLEH